MPLNRQQFVRSVHEAIQLFGNENHFEPVNDAEPTVHPPGTKSKIDEMRRRVEEGRELFHSEDKIGYDGAAEKPSSQFTRNVSVDEPIIRGRMFAIRHQSQRALFVPCSI